MSPNPEKRKSGPKEQKRREDNQPTKKAKIEIPLKRGSTALKVATELASTEDQHRAGSSTDYGSPILSSSVSRDSSLSSNDQRIDEGYGQGGLTRSFHGCIYQLKYCMLFLQRATQIGCSFCLAKEMKAAGKLDDLVFEYKEKNSTELKHRFVQFKHRAKESKKISAEDLMNVDNGDYSLLKYFVSYRKINSAQAFSESKSKDYVLCTNIDLDVGGLEKEKIYVDPVSDDFLKVTINLGEKEPKLYRLKVDENNDLYKRLKSAEDIHRLAKILVNYVRKSKKLTLSVDLLKQYHTYLADEIIDVEEKRFKKKFVDRDGLSSTAQTIRKIFLSHFVKKKEDNDGRKTLEKIEFNLSQSFGKGDNNDSSNECVRDEEINDFLRNFIIAVGQPNETQLTAMISKEMSEKFNLQDPDYTVARFQTIITDWFKEAGENGSFLTEEDAEKFFSDIEEKLIILKISRMSSKYRTELNGHDVKFECQTSELILQFLNNSASVSSQPFRLTSPHETLFHALIVNQVLKQLSKYEKDDSCMFIQLEDFLLPGLSEDFVRSFKSWRSYDLLIIDCSVKIDQLFKHSSWNDLCDIIIKENSSKKLILIDQNPNVVSPSGADEIGFKTLDKDSQKKLLDKSVEFQGSLERSWADLLGIQDSGNLKEEELEDLEQIFNVDKLAKLLRDETIKIGEGVDEFDENLKNYYIDRTIVRRGFIEKSIFEGTEETDLFAISGVFTGKLRSLAQIFQAAGSAEPRNKKCIRLDWDKESESFANVCKENPNSNVHWLYGNRETETLVCKKSTGGFSRLVKKYDDESSIHGNDESPKHEDDKIPIDVWFEEDELLTANEDQERGIVVISDIAGMGKSTLLKKISQRMKTSDPNLLVIRVELSFPENTRALDEEKTKKVFRNTEEAVDFLIDKLVRPGADSKIFKRLIVKLEGRSALLFDGFDEISPTYSETVGNLLEALSGLKIKKLIVTTRPHTRTMMKGQFGTRSHALLPFSEDNQKTCLINFWKSELSPADRNKISNDNLTRRAQKIINLLSESINDRLREFTGIPLQTQMLAEVYRPVLDVEDNESSVVLSSIPEKIDIIDLYGEFVQKKYDIYFEDKNDGNKSNQGQKSINISARELSDAAHKKLALETFFGEDDVEALLISQTEIGIHFKLWRKGHKDGERTGIISRIVDGKPRFVHRTFAEYFAALFLFDTLIDQNRNKNLRKFFLSKFFMLPEHETIRAFVNSRLSSEFDSRRNEIPQKSETLEKLENQEPWEFDLNKYRNKNEDTVYHVAAKERNTGLIRFFLYCQHSADRKVWVNIKNEDSRTALHVAALKNKSDLELIKCLVDAGADVYDVERPLNEAVEADYLEAVEYLLDKGAFIDACHGPHRILINAIISNKTKIAIEFIERGADIHSEDFYTDTPLMVACEFGNNEVVKHLIEKGANINGKNQCGKTSLHLAMKRGNVELSELLITRIDLAKQLAYINDVDGMGRTALMIACEARNYEVEKYLIEKGADIKRQDFDGNTLMDYRARGSALDGMEVA